MAFGDVNIQNTQATTGTAQPTPVATPVVPEVTTTVIDLELQKILQTFGLSIEQWNAMTPQEQANKRAEYTQIQQQATTEQTNMGVTGLHVEQTSTDSTPVANTEIGHEHAHEHEHEHSHEHIEDATQQTHEHDEPSDIKWFLTSSKNKRIYARDKFIEREGLQNLSEEEQELAFNKDLDRHIIRRNNYTEEQWANLTDKQKDELRKDAINGRVWRMEEKENQREFVKKNFIEKQGLQNLSKEEQELAFNEFLLDSVKAEKNYTDDEWNRLSEKEKNRFLNEKIKEDILIISSGKTKEELDQMEYHEILKLEIDAQNAQINQMLAKIEEHHKIHGDHHDEAIQSDCIQDRQNHNILEVLNNDLKQDTTQLQQAMTIVIKMNFVISHSHSSMFL